MLVHGINVERGTSAALDMTKVQSTTPLILRCERSEPRRTHSADAGRYSFRVSPSRFAAIRSSQRAGSISGRIQFISRAAVTA